MRWLSRISRDLLGGTWADVFESYYEVKDLYYSTSEIAKKYMPVASGTCIELAYRQVGQYKFDPEKHMHTPVNLHITAADLPELARIIPRLSQAALLWLDRKVQSVDDIRSIQDELGMTSVFKGNPALLASTYTLHSVRNDHTHGRGTMGYDRRLMMETVDQHIDSIVRQVPSLRAVFLMMGVHWAVSRGYMDEAVRTYQMVLAEVDSAGPTRRCCT